VLVEWVGSFSEERGGGRREEKEERREGGEVEKAAAFPQALYTFTTSYK
jgi:hypothetical protein